MLLVIVRPDRVQYSYKVIEKYQILFYTTTPHIPNDLLTIEKVSEQIRY